MEKFPHHITLTPTHINHSHNGGSSPELRANKARDGGGGGGCVSGRLAHSETGNGQPSKQDEGRNPQLTEGDSTERG